MPGTVRSSSRSGWSAPRARSSTSHSAIWASRLDRRSPRSSATSTNTGTPTGSSRSAALCDRPLVLLRRDDPSISARSVNDAAVKLVIGWSTKPTTGRTGCARCGKALRRLDVAAGRDQVRRPMAELGFQGPDTHPPRAHDPAGDDRGATGRLREPELRHRPAPGSCPVARVISRGWGLPRGHWWGFLMATDTRFRTEPCTRRPLGRPLPAGTIRSSAGLTSRPADQVIVRAIWRACTCGLPDPFGAGRRPSSGDEHAIR